MLRSISKTPLNEGGYKALPKVSGTAVTPASIALGGGLRLIGVNGRGIFRNFLALLKVATHEENFTACGESKEAW